MATTPARRRPYRRCARHPFVGERRASSQEQGAPRPSERLGTAPHATTGATAASRRGGIDREWWALRRLPLLELDQVAVVNRAAAPVVVPAVRGRTAGLSGRPPSPDQRSARGRAHKIAPGTTLLSSNGSAVQVQADHAFNKHARTYNLTVDDLHTYYVVADTTPVLVGSLSLHMRTMRRTSP
ncbi:polymorphic toxin-type HINT domain-containing protein [Streptomyces lydicus]|uniref:polymorphic toxin-type HINT domain-containing protein n=1 Tax=Streptomyces lydicus TaxID=47763 RepID=UPI00343EAACD